MAELSLGGGRVRLRLDRIDRIAQGRVVLDYKSGRPGNPDWCGERPTHPQLLAYLASLGADVVALATVNVTAREVRFCGLGGSSPTSCRRCRAPRWPAPRSARPGRRSRRRWEGLLSGLISEFLAGAAQVDPAPGACDYCHLAALCRIGAHQAQEAAAAADETDE